jgi:hypothetical protein
MLEKAKCDGYQHVYELQKTCFVRLSFVKGWGADYHRQVKDFKNSKNISLYTRMSHQLLVGLKYNYINQWR